MVDVYDMVSTCCGKVVVVLPGHTADIACMGFKSSSHMAWNSPHYSPAIDAPNCNRCSEQHLY